MMKKNFQGPIIMFLVGMLLIAGAWWTVHCQCLTFKSLTPAALRDFIQSFGRLAVAVYIVAYALNTISIVPPIAALSLTAGLAFGAFWGALYLMTGAMLGTSATFIISKKFGRSLVEKILRGRFKDLDEKLEHNGFMTVLFFRVIPLIPYEVLNYASGLSRITFKDYFWATFLGIIPGVVVSAFFGGNLGEIRTWGDIFRPKFFVAVGLMVIIIAVPAIYKIMKNKR